MSSICPINKRIMSPVLKNDKLRIKSPILNNRNEKFPTFSKRRNIDINLLRGNLSTILCAKNVNNEAGKIREDINSVEAMLMIHQNRMRCLSRCNAKICSNDKYTLSNRANNKDELAYKQRKRSKISGLLSP